MQYLILGTIILGIILAIAHYFGNRKQRQSEAGSHEQQQLNAGEAGSSHSSESDCCGEHEVCERDSLLAAVSKDIEYYNDEELDVYREIASDGYDDKAVDEFREVLYTMQEIEVAGWLRSLQLRNINLPDRLKDEALLIVEERRTRKINPIQP